MRSKPKSHNFIVFVVQLIQGCYVLLLNIVTTEKLRAGKGQTQDYLVSPGTFAQCRIDFQQSLEVCERPDGHKILHFLLNLKIEKLNQT